MTLFSLTMENETSRTSSSHYVCHANTQSFQDESAMMSASSNDTEAAEARVEAAPVVDFCLNEPLTLRKNLQLKFEQQAVAAVVASSSTTTIGTTYGATVKQDQSVMAKVAHFESTAFASAPGATASFDSTTNTATTTAPALPARPLSVYLRLRPLVNRKEVSTLTIVPADSQMHPNTKIRTRAPTASLTRNAVREQVKDYTFTRVFDAAASQASFYRETAAPLVQGVVAGSESALLLAYGITNAGKTHTMLGSMNSNKLEKTAAKLPADWGLIPRALADLLGKMDPSNSRLKVTLHLQYFEIYKDCVYDLLPRTTAAAETTTTNGSKSKKTMQQQQQRTALKVADYQDQVLVRGLCRHSVPDLATGLALIAQASQARHTATNHLNAASSRSHAVCQFTVTTTTVSRSVIGAVSNKQSATAAALSSSQSEKHLWMVDLAGSERSKRTGVGALRQKEASWINQSLMTLMRCLQALKDNQNSSSDTTSNNNNVVVPYRDCKLTHLLSQHWNNSSGKTSMIVNVHGGQADYSETQHVLQYAAMAKSIAIVPNAAAASSGTATASSANRTVEYGYNGRKKATTAGSSVRTKIAKIVRKLSPKRHGKRKSIVVDTIDGGGGGVASKATASSASRTVQWMPAAKRRRAGEKLVETTKPAAMNVAAMPNIAMADSKELVSLKTTLSIAQAEAQVLRQEKRDLQELAEATEMSVRAEVAEEMDEQMKAMREQYQGMMDRLKSQLPPVTAQVQNARSAKKVQMDRATEKVDELLIKVEECEEEMQRMRQEHQDELENVVGKYEASLATSKQELVDAVARADALQAKVEQLEQELQAAQDISTTVVDDAGAGAPSTDQVLQLEQELASARAQVTKVERSKQELIESYEKLLRDESENEDDEEEEEDDEESSDSEAESPPKKQDARRLTRRQIQHQEVALPPSSKATRSTRASARRPLEAVSSNIKRSDSALSEDSFGPNQWLFPKKPKKDPATGTFLRPRGRAPSGAEAWDENKGAWRLSVA